MPCSAAGGEVVGVIPHTLMERDSHTSVTRLHVYSMHERKALGRSVGRLRGAAGGVGTFEELFEAIT
jgi:predicted Rossmann-fold nucleotide-binding protein